MVTIGWACAPPIDVAAETILLKSGEAIEGSIIHTTRNTVVIRRAIGGMRQMPIQEVEEVRIDLMQGQEICGQFLGWADGVYRVRSGDKVIQISQGSILSSEPSHATAKRPPRQSAQKPEEQELINRPAVSIPEQTGARKTSSESSTVAVKGTVNPPEEGAQNIVFKLELSRPAEQAVVLIYGTVDDTAKAGKHYEPRQGVLTLAPGTKSAEVRVPLIEHQVSEGSLRFELFLIADPRTAEVLNDRVIATIQGDD